MKVFLFIFLVLIASMAQAVSVCQRNSFISSQIEKLSSRPCGQVTEAELSDIRELNVDFNDVSAPLVPSDFEGLTALKVLRLQNGLELIPDNLFEHVSGLEELEMTGNRLTQLSGKVFRGLKSLRILNLDNNNLTSLPAGIFSDLISVALVQMDNNHLGNSLTKDVIGELPGWLSLRLNQINNLPYDIFEGYRGNFIDISHNPINEPLLCFLGEKYSQVRIFPVPKCADESLPVPIFP